MANLVTPPELAWTDPAYSQAVGAARQTYDSTVNPLLQQRGTQAAQYGYTPTYDANGMVQSVAQDPTNPYSKANLLTTSYKEGQARNTNSFAGRGQLYAGSLNAAQGQGTRGYNIGSNNLQQAFIDFIAGNQAQINTAGSNYANAVSGEYGNALGRYVPPAPVEPTAHTAATGGGRPAPPMNPYYPNQPLGTGFAGLDPNTKYQQASDGKTLLYLRDDGKWVPVK